MARTAAPALRRGLDILELFLESGNALRVPDIAERLGIPRASAHELVGALVERGYLQERPDSPHRFTLGIRAFQLGGAYERGLDIVRLGGAVAQEVASACGETVQVMVRDGRDVVYVVKVDSIHSIRIVSDVGSRLPASCTAGGKATLAWLSEPDVSALFSEDTLPTMTDRSIRTVDRLRDDLALARDRGWAEENSESNEDVACVAAPVFDKSGACVAAISIAVPTTRWSDEEKARNVRLVVEGAAKLSAQLGARPHGNH